MHFLFFDISLPHQNRAQRAWVFVITTATLFLCHICLDLSPKYEHR